MLINTHFIQKVNELGWAFSSKINCKAKTPLTINKTKSAIYNIGPIKVKFTNFTANAVHPIMNVLNAKI